MSTRPTIKQIAATAGVSSSTVSRALAANPRISQETTNRVQIIAAQLGYQPNTIARSLKTGTSKVIGLIVADISNPFYTELMRGVESTALAAGYSVILCNSNNDVGQEENHIALLEERRVDGILLTPVNDLDASIRRRPVDHYVLLDYYSDQADISCVCVDHEQGAYTLTQHLISLGHRRIAHINGRFSFHPCQEALRGYLKAMDKAGLERDKAWIRETNLRMEDGYRAMQELLGLSNRPTAVFAFGDVLALGAYRAIEQAHLRIPDQVAVAGYDDIPFAELVSLTTVAQDKSEIGRIGTQILIRQIETKGRVMHQKVMLQPKLVVRMSTEGRGDKHD